LESMDLEKLILLLENLVTWRGWNTGWWLPARERSALVPGQPYTVGLTLERLGRISPRNWSLMGLEGSELRAAASPCADSRALWPAEWEQVSILLLRPRVRQRGLRHRVAFVPLVSGVSITCKMRFWEQSYWHTLHIFLY